MDLNTLLANNPSLADKFSKLPESDQALIMGQLGTPSGEGPNGKVYLDPRLTPAEKQQALTQQGVLQGYQPTTPGAQLREDNNPITQGLAAAGDSASKGVLGTLAAPGAGLGQAAGTTAHNILSNIPGLGGPAGIIPAAGAALAHGGAQILGDTVSGKLAGDAIGTLLAKAPPAVVAAINAIRSKGVGGAISDALPTITKEGKINQVATQLGQPATFGERVAAPLAQDVKALYNAAEAQGPVATNGLRDLVTQALDKEKAAANPNSVTVKQLTGLQKKFTDNAQLAYSDVLDEMQRLKKTAQGLYQRLPQAATTLRDTSNGMLDILDQTSPLARQAGSLYRKDLAAKDIIETLRGANPGQKIRTLFEQDPSLPTQFGINTPQKIEEFAKVADKIGTAKTAGQLITRLSGYGVGLGLAEYAFHRKIWDLFSGH